MTESIVWVCHVCRCSFPTASGSICHSCSKPSCLLHTHVVETEVGSGSIKHYQVKAHTDLIGAFNRRDAGKCRLRIVCSNCISESLH